MKLNERLCSVVVDQLPKSKRTFENHPCVPVLTFLSYDSRHTFYECENQGQISLFEEAGGCKARKDRASKAASKRTLDLNSRYARAFRPLKVEHLFSLREIFAEGFATWQAANAISYHLKLLLAPTAIML